MLSKMTLIERIGQLNRSARAEFLAEFDEAELQQYLTNLEAIWSDFNRQLYPSPESSFKEYEPVLMAG